MRARQPSIAYFLGSFVLNIVAIILVIVEIITMIIIVVACLAVVGFSVYLPAHFQLMLGYQPPDRDCNSGPSE